MILKLLSDLALVWGSGYVFTYTLSISSKLSGVAAEDQTVPSGAISPGFRTPGDSSYLPQISPKRSLLSDF